MKLVDEVRQERIPVQTCKRVPVQETRQVAVVEERIVPVKETRYVERVELYRVPIDPCTGQPLPVISSSAAPIQGLAQPQPQPADPRTFKDENGETTRRKPAEEPATKTEAEKQAEAAKKEEAVKSAELNADSAKDNSPQWKAKSSAESDAQKANAAKKAAESGNVDLKKPALDDNGQATPQKSVLKENGK
jgi:hypothetical protein